MLAYRERMGALYSSSLCSLLCEFCRQVAPLSEYRSSNHELLEGLPSISTLVVVPSSKLRLLLNEEPLKCLPSASALLVLSIKGKNNKTEHGFNYVDLTKILIRTALQCINIRLIPGDTCI